jgi:hypothetical protein
VLRNNGGDDLSVTANGPVVFATPLASGATYSVTVLTQPTSPGQTCIVASGSGTVSHANVTTVGIFCAPNTYTVGGTVSGLVGSGLLLRNNGGDDLAVSANGTFSFATPLVSGAAYSVTVFSQPTNPAQTCVVTDGSGTMPNGNVTTVAIACVTNVGTGAVRVTVATTGPDAPASDTVVVDPGSSWYDTAVVPANGTISFPLDSGDHTVGLAVAPNCTVISPNFVTVTVAAGVTTDVAFSVTCVANGTLRVTVATTGSNAPAAYSVFVDPSASPPPYYGGVPANGTVSFAVASGNHTVFLQVARNCTVTSSNNVGVTVAAGAPTDVAFSVTCLAYGTILFSVTTTGSNLPVGDYSVTAYLGFSEVPYNWRISQNGTTGFAVPPGSYWVQLRSLPPNCTVGHANGGNPRSVSVASGTTTNVAFAVTCVATGTLRVTVATTGPNAPPDYTLGVDPDPDGIFGYRYNVTVSSNGVTVSNPLPVGQHVATLVVLTPCFVTSPNPVSVTLTSGVTNDLGFTVSCQ